MRKLHLATLSFMALLASCGKTPEGSIIAHLDGYQNDTVYIQSFPLGGMGRELDTVVVRNGKILVAKEIYYPMTYCILSGQTNDTETKDILFNAFPGEKLVVKAQYQPKRVDYIVEGSSAFGQDFVTVEASLNDIKDAYYDQFIAYYDMLAKEPANPEIVNIQKEINQLFQQMTGVRAQYVSQHPDKQLSLFYTSMMSGDSLLKYFPLLDPSLQDSISGLIYRQTIKRVDLAKLRKEAKKEVSAGQQAPNFTLPDPSDKLLSLSSLKGKGKYVLLDFWGNWNTISKAEFPKMIEYYNKYAPKLEILGINCGDSEFDWAAARANLPWKHVRNIQGFDENSVSRNDFADVTDLYKVEEYPCRILIDPQGKIIGRFEGLEGDIFKFIDQTLN